MLPPPISIATYFYPNISRVVQLMTFFIVVVVIFKPNNMFSHCSLCQRKGRQAIGMNRFVGDVQMNRGAIRRANHFQNRVWGWTRGRCTSGTRNVLYKGMVTFSCVLKSLLEMEADLAEAEELCASCALPCFWGCEAADSAHCRMG